jgi:pimeloyl-ACP methyl ester carboxylesterase
VTRLKRASLVGLLVVALVLAALALYDRQQGPTGGWLAQAGLEPRFEQVDGLRLRYVRAGQGSPVLLLHGFSSSLFTWRDVLPGLASQHDVVALDFPGFGGSEIPADLSPERMRRAALGLAQRLGLARPALVGHSMGGAVAAALSSDPALDPRRVALIDAATFAMGTENRPPMVRLVGTPRVGSLTDLLPVRRLTTTLALRQVFFDGRLVTAERVDEYVAPLRRPGFTAAMLSLLRANAAVESEIPRRWAATRAPALVLWGRDDAWIPVSHAERHRAALPAARVVVLERCGHMPQEEQPAETLRLLLDFLEDPR